MQFWRSVKNHLFPYHGNAHRPHILRRGWLLAFLGVALMCEALILGHAVFKGPNVFLAAVLRSEVVAYTAQARVSEGGSKIAENELLTIAAQAKANDMAAKGYFSHTGPGGEEPWSWISEAGYDYVYAGENLAVRFDDSKAVVDAWMASPAHRANIVKAQYQEVGVGIAEGTYKGGPATFVVQFFASPSVAQMASVSEPAVTEVAATEPTQEAPAPISVVPSTGAPQPSVAGAEAAPAAIAYEEPLPPGEQGFAQSFMRAVGSVFGESRTTATWALASIAAILLTVLALTFFIRIQVQPTDLMVPAIAVVMVALLLLGANAKFLPSVDTQSASVLGSSGGEVGSAAATQRVPVSLP